MASQAARLEELKFLTDKEREREEGREGGKRERERFKRRKIMLPVKYGQRKDLKVIVWDCR